MFLLRKIRRRIKGILAIFAAITVAFSVGGNDSQSEPVSETKGLILSTTQSKTTEMPENETTVLSAESGTYIILADDMTIIKGKGASFADGVVTVSKSGTYSFKGELKDGRIIVDLKDDGEVKLNFYGVNVNSTKGAPLSVIKAPDKAVLYFDERTVNDFSDTEDRVYTYDEDTGDSAVIFSKEDIVFEGNGFVRIKADFNKGVFSKKDIT
ncbi:MAG: carbohydrate-binding domain-containing protein, partial [Clostridia bacterium]|nr:carbohydrate-binding domain-containing protein [Clostridia bacterium]